MLGNKIKSYRENKKNDSKRSSKHTKCKPCNNVKI